jgi:glycopeptide antibiotics resistance protein
MRSTGRRNRKESRKLELVRHIGLFFFLVYLACLVYFLLFANWYNHAPGSHVFYNMNLKPFREIRRFMNARDTGALSSTSIFLNLSGNVIGFIPFGFLLPVISGKLRHFWLAVLLGALFSASIEILQLLTRSGSFDVDDIILNTAGTALGYILFLICDRIFRKAEQRYGK